MAVWNDETEAQLRKLYVTEGLSAGQCAARMPGFTRNAIIGKVHRMGFGGRKTLVRISHPRKAQKPSKQHPGVRAPSQARSSLSAIFAEKPQPYVGEPDLVIPVSERKTVATLGANDCKWPIGDPQHEDFHFCGKKQDPGLVYCGFHARRAYQPPPDTRSHRQAPQNVPGGHGQPVTATATSETSSHPAAKIKETV